MISKNCSIQFSHNAIEISKAYDYTLKENSTFNLKLPTFPQEYNIGYIVGTSGSGKSTLLSSFGENAFKDLTWDYRLIVDYFSTPQEAIDRLNMSGFSTVPSYFLSINHLSAGQAYRVMLSRSLKSNCTIDEFTSGLDRLTARSVAFCVQKYIRKHNLKNVVIASCYKDIIRWLSPDWIYDVDQEKFLENPIALSSWQISTEIYNIDEKKLCIKETSKEAWNKYSKFHYLSSNLMENSKCYEAFLKVDDYETSVGFIAVSILPSGTLSNAYREHRLVVHPSIQGVGLGIIISEYIAEKFVKEGYRYYAKTSHPRLGLYRNNSSKWKATCKNLKNIGENKDKVFGKTSANKRVCFSHEFVGIERGELKKDTIKIVNFNGWLPLKTYGTYEVLTNGNVRTCIDHKKMTFEKDVYGTTENALLTAQNYLLTQSLNKKINFYTIVNQIAYVKIDNDYLTVDPDIILRMQNHYWTTRELSGKTYACSTINGQRKYIEELICEVDRDKVQHLDGNTLNNLRSNLLIK